MTSFKTVALIAAVTATLNVTAQTDHRPDTEKMGLKGAVKSVTESINNSGSVTYTFDDHGYRTDSEQRYIYDSRNRLSMASDKNGKYIYEYNSKGNLVEYTQNSESGYYRENYTYDENNNMTVCTASNSKVSFYYDENSRLIRTNDAYGNVLKKFTYTSDGKIATERNNNGLITYSYDAQGRKNSCVTENEDEKTEETLTYDKNGFISARVVTVTAKNGKTVENHNYTVDTTGNWTKDVVSITSPEGKSEKVYTRTIEYFGAARQLFLLK